MPTQTRVKEYVQHLNKVCDVACDRLQDAYDAVAPLDDAELTRNTLLDTMVELTDTYGTIAGELAAEFYEEEREAQHGGDYTVEIAEPWGAERYREAVKYASRRFYG